MPHRNESRTLMERKRILSGRRDSYSVSIDLNFILAIKMLSGELNMRAGRWLEEFILTNLTQEQFERLAGYLESLVMTDDRKLTSSPPPELEGELDDLDEDPDL